MRARFRRLSAVVRVLAVSALVLVGLAPAGMARAASVRGSTTGTASTVSPSTIALGGTLTYTLSGFPPGAVVDVVVDDGALQESSGGASEVVASLTVAEDGTAQGSFELPAYVDEGAHWLRFSASGGPDVPTSAVPTRDYTNRSPFFTVGEVTVIGGTSSVAPLSDQDQETGVGSSATPGDGQSTAPEIIEVPSQNEPAAQGSVATQVGGSGFPVVGASVLALGVGAVALAAVVVVRRRTSSYVD